ncbi:tRNA N6-adenosine threonylcarbamoyltransferase [Campylobacterota bacterium]|nr:tRNA N6-adenosine threonylcarbamoyltransferase [Campylobacterota bacterium]
MILAIESSCDDSAVAIIEIASYKIALEARESQNDAHNAYGGVVPELAARLHAENLPKLLELAAPYFGRLKAIAVTNRPGLTVALAGGVVMAQALSLALKLPIICIHHIAGHLYSLFIESEARFPLSALMVSGGHTLLIDADKNGRLRQVAASLDDALGEAFDKCAKLLGLGYPGGAALEKLAGQGDENRFDFPIPLRGDDRLAFSYSGLKNSVRLACEKAATDGAIDEKTRADIAASFQKAAVAHLLRVTDRFVMRARPQRLGLIGGVSANEYLRSRFASLCTRHGIEPLFAPLSFCGDNAAMIARAAVVQFHAGAFAEPSEIKIVSRERLE